MTLYTRSLTSRTLCVTLLAFCFMGVASERLATAAELDARGRQAVGAVNTWIRKAGDHFKKGEIDRAGDAVMKAMKQIETAMNVATPELYDALEPAMKRIETARTMLELEGASLPPFRRPKRPDHATQPEAENAEEKMVVQPEMDTPSASSSFFPVQPATTAVGGVSFSNHVAPILIGKCGRCHVSGSKGGFNMATYAALMKGSKAGVVVFPGDVASSELVGVIESGEMPPNGNRLSSMELTTLKTWIASGAKFDGVSPDSPIDSGIAAPSNTQKTATPIARATGKETVSFAMDVAPLLLEGCVGCHIDAMRTQGGLRMDTFAQLLRGGDSGSIVTPGNAAGSLLIRKLRGMEGNRMPAGGRPAFSEESIQLISTWINEGAKLDGANENQPIDIMSKLAWASKATAAEISDKRKQTSLKKLQLVRSGSSQEPYTKTTDHFLVTGTASPRTIDLVAEKAESQLKVARSIVTAESGESFFHGRATLYVMPKRYDYSEFARMVESREIPSSWLSHWKYDGINAYVAVVATDRDEEDAIANRLVAPLASLAVATRGVDVPRWFAQGVGDSLYHKSGPTLDRDALRAQQADASAAFAAMKSSKQFLDRKLSPDQMDLISRFLGDAMLDRTNRRNVTALIRGLDGGNSFDQAFTSAFRIKPAQFIDQWLTWAKGR